MENLSIIDERILLQKNFRIYGTLENPLFLAKDVAEWIGLSNVTDMISRVDSDEVTKFNLGGLQGECNFLTEDGLYEVLMQSRKPIAKQFKKEVKNILKTIRKTGSYSVQPKFQVPTTFAEALRLAADQQEQIEQQAKQLEVQKPKVLFADAVETSQRSCLVAELAKILKQNGVDTGQNRLFKWLRENGYLGNKGEYYNQPTQKAMDMGLFELKKRTVNNPDGTVMVVTTTKVTPKGQIYFVNKLIEK